MIFSSPAFLAFPLETPIIFTLLISSSFITSKAMLTCPKPPSIKQISG